MPPMAIIELGPTWLYAGLSGDRAAQFSRKFDEELWEENLGTYDELKVLKLQTRLLHLFVHVLDKLNMTPTKCQVVIVEPALFAMTIKKWLAQILLSDLRVLSLGFLPQSVCQIVGMGQKHGLVATELYGQLFLAPVYEYREMSSKIKSAKLSEDYRDDDEMPLGDLKTRVLASVTYDVRPSLQVYNKTEASFRGALIIAQNSKILHQLSRNRYLNLNGQVYDSLFSD